ncbi:MAG: pyridoxamine 5'-phosphate oxidase family protein [Chloroflexi bacterium]|nr:pyridoxamine 5'-phosphate oxidase family protein [Chloroflexota bacterium]
MPRDYDLKVTPPSQQRRPEYALDDDAIRAHLARAQVGYVATRWETQPFVNMTTFWYDAERHEIIFHSNATGRVRANAEQFPEVCFGTNEAGRLLPSNVALEFSIQYEGVVAFGKIRVLEDAEEKRRALYGLIGKYFPHMRPGHEYRPITDGELKRTSVYAIQIESWSGKRNWPAQADQSDEWPALSEEGLREVGRGWSADM